MKHQVLFSLKSNENFFMIYVCCSRDWCFKGYVSETKIAEFAVSVDLDEVAHNELPHQVYTVFLLVFEFSV